MSRANIAFKVIWKVWLLPFLLFSITRVTTVIVMVVILIFQQRLLKLVLLFSSVKHFVHQANQQGVVTGCGRRRLKLSKQLQQLSSARRKLPQQLKAQLLLALQLRLKPKSLPV